MSSADPVVALARRVRAALDLPEAEQVLREALKREWNGAVEACVDACALAARDHSEGPHRVGVEYAGEMCARVRR